MTLDKTWHHARHPWNMKYTYMNAIKYWNTGIIEHRQLKIYTIKYWNTIEHRQLKMKMLYRGIKFYLSWVRFWTICCHDFLIWIFSVIVFLICSTNLLLSWPCNCVTLWVISMARDDKLEYILSWRCNALKIKQTISSQSVNH